MAASMRETMACATHSTAPPLKTRITPKLATAFRYLISNKAHSYIRVIRALPNITVL